MHIKDVIVRLMAASEPSRELDALIAKALGFRHVAKTSERDGYWLDPNGKQAKLPRLTSSLDAGYNLAIATAQKGAASWDGITGAACIGSGDKYIAATTPMAISIALLYAFNEAKIDANSTMEKSTTDKPGGI